jgi:hypothetical protein
MMLLFSLNEGCNFYRESNLLVTVRDEIEEKFVGLFKLLSQKLLEWNEGATTNLNKIRQSPD